MNFGQGEMLIFKETAEGDFVQQLTIDQNGIQGDRSASAEGVNLAAFGMAPGSDTPAGAGPVDMMQGQQMGQAQQGMPMMA